MVPINRVVRIHTLVFWGHLHKDSDNRHSQNVIHLIESLCNCQLVLWPLSSDVTVTDTPTWPRKNQFRGVKLKIIRFSRKFDQ